jgi:hypothetical protein
LIDDFRSLTIDGTVAWSGSQDKGHTALVAAFARSLDQAIDDTSFDQSLGSSRTTLAALGSVLNGYAVAVEHDTR